MQTQSTEQNSTVILTDNAAKQIAQLVAKENNPEMKFRISIGGGGCSGFKYFFEFDTNQNDDDIVVEKEGTKVLVDSTSIQYLGGAEIDFVEDLGYSNFEIKNPNATSRCGCGNSFNA